MEKINKEELLEKFNMTEDDLEKIAGGDLKDYLQCLMDCAMVFIMPGESYDPTECQKEKCNP